MVMPVAELEVPFMTGFITKLATFIGKLRGDLCRYPRSWIEIDEDGFSLRTGWYFFNPHFHPLKRPKVYWNTIKEIHALETDYCMMLEFVHFSGKPTLVDADYIENWDTLVKYMPKRFPDFNMHNFEETKFLGGGGLPCWHFEKQIGNLKVDIDNSIIIWEKDGSIFDKIEG